MPPQARAGAPARRLPEEVAEVPALMRHFINRDSDVRCTGGVTHLLMSVLELERVQRGSGGPKRVARRGQS